MMSAVDKLHKLYASTARPVVWARSTGLEVLNEVDALKAGIIGAAGGQSGAHGGPGFLWSTVASGVEKLVGGAQVASAVGSGLRAATGRVLQQLVAAASRPDINRRE
jgi:ubiquinone biosynthesis monooxygenase Coq6